MRKHVFAGSLLAAFTLATPAPANTPDKAPPHQKWSFEGATGTYDKASLQRGFLVYDHVCASCHGMRSLTYRDLEGIGLSDQAITDLAHSKQIPGPVGISGMPTMRPGLPDDHFRSPFPNDAAAAAVMGGVAPPDQSRLAAVHPGGADWLYAFLTGYRMPPPADAPIVPGKFYNDWAEGHMIGMPPPLMNGAIQYPDGTPATVEQQAKDITTFLVWAADPHRNERHHIGKGVLAYLAVLLVLAIAWKRKIWKNLKSHG